MQRYKTKVDSQVGYKRPPVESRFKKGQSGNPQGRRRAPATVAAMFAEELRSTVVISENGRRLKVSKMQVLIKEAIKQGMNRNFQPLMLMTKMSHVLEELSQTTKNPTTDPLEKVDARSLSTGELEERIERTRAQIDRMLAKERGVEQSSARRRGDQRPRLIHG